MKLDKMLTSPVKALVILFFVQTVFADDGTWLKRDGVGTGGTNWTEWSDAENWVDGVVASNTATTAEANAKLSAAVQQYIRLPEGTMSLKSIAGPSGHDNWAVLCGDGVLSIPSPAGNGSGIYLYTEWKWAHNNYYNGLCGVEVCGTCLSIPNNNMLFNGSNRFRYDLFANSTDAFRTNDIFKTSVRFKDNGSAVNRFYAPKGSDVDLVRTFAQTADSPFLAPLGEAEILPVGTTVTGAGVPDGTFLKRIFPDGTIELSAPVTETIAENDLTFAAFAPKVYQSFDMLGGFNGTGAKTLAIQKYREQDDIRVRFPSISYMSGNTDADKKKNATFTITADDGFFPGTMVLNAAYSSASYLNLKRAHLEIHAAMTGLALSIPEAGDAARLTVPAGKSASVKTLSDLAGSLTKDGAGMLTLPFDSDLAGEIVVGEGTLALSATNVYRIAAVTVKSGATFQMPTCGVRIGTLTVEPGAVIRCPTALYGTDFLQYETLAGDLSGVLLSLYQLDEEERTLDFQSVHLVINDNLDATRLTVSTAAATARLTVDAGVSASFKSLDALAGTIVKDGAGTLTLPVGSDLAGAVVLEEGTLSLTASEVCRLAALTIKSGAVFQMPDCGIRIGTLTVEPGARIVGSVPLQYETLVGDPAGLILSDGVDLVNPTATGDLQLSVVSGQAVCSGAGGDSVLTFEADAKLRVWGKGVLDLLVVGGGGGGGAYSGGGGGGGGVVYTQKVSVVEGFYAVVVGDGGVGGINVSGSQSGGNGGNSVGLGFTAYGGGGGAYATAGKSGASGGGAGAGYWYPASGTGKQSPGGSAIYGDQGFGGGASTNVYRNWNGTKGGGGGGAGGPGADATVDKAGDGGNGRDCDITGTGVCYGGGGGGGAGGYSGKEGKGGSGGGGRAGYTATYPAMVDAKDGTDGLGGGGGGGASAGDATGNGGKGGRGVVIIRYRASRPVDPYERGTGTSDAKVTYRKGFEIHTFRANGTFTLAQDTVVDLLLVGGGGSGGFGCGGGGGGGGVNVLTNVFLLAGTYQIGVGTGGALATGWASHSGTGSFVYQEGTSLTNLQVKGGGGGGSRGDSDGLGRSGGSGGGAGGAYSAWEQKLIKGGKGVAGQGHDGGTSLNLGKGQNWCTYGAGGGGAGEPGGNSDGSVSPKVLGIGGCGVWCDFSGRNVCYGGGGSGGSCDYQYGTNNYLVASSDGGGGRGAGIKSPWNTGAYPGEDGKDGLGGGGGGGGANADNNAGGTGGKGGDGCVIIRYPVKPVGSLLLVR